MNKPTAIRYTINPTSRKPTPPAPKYVAWFTRLPEKSRAAIKKAWDQMQRTET